MPLRWVALLAATMVTVSSLAAQDAGGRRDRFRGDGGEGQGSS